MYKPFAVKCIKYLLSLRAMAKHHNGVLRNESLLKAGPHNLGLFDVKSTVSIRNTYCRPISAEIRLC